MKLNPHLTFNGQCEAAFRFYEKCLGGEIGLMMTYGESPVAGQMTPDWRETGWKMRRKRSASFTRWRKTAWCNLRCRRLSGQCVLAC